MCGFAGFWDSSSSEIESLEFISKMIASLESRGPDGSGVWHDLSSGIYMGHRRLSIQDLSPAGRQPMLSHCSRYVISFNGEIYNHREIRTELIASGFDQTWVGHSDTETLLAAIEAYGLATALSKCVGMFAFSLWDKQRKELTLARDRLGEKPLYYGFQNGVFLFGSQLKALRRHLSFANQIDRNSLALYFRHNAIAAPHSIYDGIYKLYPGSFVTLTQACLDNNYLPDPIFYWSLSSVIHESAVYPFCGTQHDAISELDKLINLSVSQQMLSDVPIGAFLSGGIDSSIIVASMQSQSTKPVSTFTIGFTEANLNEAEHASKIAEYLGTNHTELYINQSDALDVVSDLPAIYDEPFSDSSQIPTFLVSRLAKQKVTVTLSGDGGDELFCGYQRYLFAANTWSTISKLPRSFRNIISKTMLSIHPAFLDFPARFFAYLIPSLRNRNLPDSFSKFASLLSHRSPESFYRSCVSHINDPESLVLHSNEPYHALSDSNQFSHITSYLSKMMALDTITYLPDDILTKVDRASMGVSLESRIPFLDHRIVEFAWSLPLSLKVRNNEQKWILKQVLSKHIPLHLFDRPKMGFGVPLASWLRGPLRDLCDSLFAPSRIASLGYLNHHLVTKYWEEHKAGTRNWQYILWDILVWELWLMDNS